ncbi:MAG: thioredoxin family protein [Pedosphaera sp.]|nr:thioredoxin family protein [Pedosphaera sp.]
MKKLLLSLLLCWVALQVGAAEADWLTDFSKAQSKAQADKKMILLEFTGSDWCPPCKALHKNVFTSDEFVKFAKDNLVLVLVDFPQTKKQTEEQKKANEELAKKFGAEGFPTVIVLSSEGTQLNKQVGYDNESAKDFVKKLQALKDKEKGK